jgi:hypothetical protein
MPRQDLPEVVALARSLLKKYPDRMQVLTELCEKTQMNAGEAEEMVNALMAAGDAELPPQPATRSGTKNRNATFIALVVILNVILLLGLAALTFLIINR